MIVSNRFVIGIKVLFESADSEDRGANPTLRFAPRSVTSLEAKV